GMIQMLPEDILKYGIDADGDGKVNLKESVADALMTAGNVLNVTGWRPNQPWLVEVIVPEQLNWQLAQPTHFQSLDEWKEMGIVPRDGVWPDLTYEAALLLPHGRLGPAFFAFPNYSVYLEWNKSFVYSTTSAFFATLLSGNPIYLDGTPPPPLPDEDVIRLQTILANRGHDVGKVDGIVGARTRAAVRQEQLNFGLPADAWPTKELLELLEKS
ncbi:MAG: peptidoglycan-binding protein, partial [Rhodobacteraceae bacterium]|nr:peptidoglycan-binding protein [Paracoccaceae bacterium]